MKANLQIRQEIKRIIEAIVPFDVTEKEAQSDACAWIDSGSEIFRLESPATPPKHLVCYTVIIDLEKSKILLLEHRKAGLLLPSGGHLEKAELPQETAVRELKEELAEDLPFAFGKAEPFFISNVETVGKTAGHIDVDLWYIFTRDSDLPLETDNSEFQREFAGFAWYTFTEILAMDSERLDPNFQRLVKKLLTVLA